MMIPVLSVAMSLALPAVTATASLAAFFVFDNTAYCKSYQTCNNYKCNNSSHKNNSFLLEKVRILQRMPDTDSSSDTCSVCQNNYLLNIFFVETFRVVLSL